MTRSARSFRCVGWHLSCTIAGVMCLMHRLCFWALRPCRKRHRACLRRIFRGDSARPLRRALITLGAIPETRHGTSRKKNTTTKRARCTSRRRWHAISLHIRSPCYRGYSRTAAQRFPRAGLCIRCRHCHPQQHRPLTLTDIQLEDTDRPQLTCVGNVARPAADAATAALLESAKFILADNAHGETPTIPARIHACSASASDSCPITALLMQLQAVASVAMENVSAGVFCPRTLEELLGIFERVAPTYLSLDANRREYSHLGGISPALEAAFTMSTGGTGASVVEYYVQFAVTTLVASAASSASIALASVELLLVLAKSRSLRSGIITLECWQQLMGLFSEGNEAIAALGYRRCMRTLVEALCCAGLVDDPGTAAEYFEAIKGPVSSR